MLRKLQHTSKNVLPDGRLQKRAYFTPPSRDSSKCPQDTTTHHPIDNLNKIT
jgi:hypothetical protein